MILQMNKRAIWLPTSTGLQKTICCILCLLLICIHLPIGAKAAQSTGVTNSDVILRSKASTSSVPLATVRAGREVILVEKVSDWYKITTGSLTGYIQAKYMEIKKLSAVSTSSSDKSTSSSLTLGDKGSEVKALQTMLRSAGYFSEEITANFGPVTQQAVIQFQKDNGLSSDGQVGKATYALLEKVTSSKQQTASASSSSALKKGAEGDSVRALQIALKEKGFFSDEITGYYGVKTQSAVLSFQQAMGFVADGVAGTATMSKLTNSTNMSSDSASSTLRLGAKGDAVVQLQKLLKNAGYYSGSADGDFGEGTHKALVAYQTASGLTADGVAGSKTVSLLSSVGSSGSVSVPVIADTSSNASNNTNSSTSSSGGALGNVATGSVSASQTNGSVKLVDWWSGEIDSVYPRKAIAQVLDIRTGITFQMYRFGGTNHLDFEPATTADTELMRQIVDGAWSWSARPIIVTIGNTRYAAAMNTMPHGDEHLKDNGMDGQCCIHFLNSWTHTGKQPNNDMQMQIMVAYNSGS